MLRYCASGCKITHLTRTIPLRQGVDFVRKFDDLVRRGFEKLLNIPLDDRWWRQAKLPAKHGGMALRTELSRLGANYTMSVARVSSSIPLFTGKAFDPALHLEAESKSWLCEALGTQIDIPTVVDEIQYPSSSSTSLSLSQRCEHVESERLKSLLNRRETLHALAHSGSDHFWVTELPLRHKKRNLSPKHWLAAARRRLMLDVSPAATHCSMCVKAICDTKGGHALICPGGSSTQLRHNKLVRRLHDALRRLGLRVGMEHGGGLDDHRRPGDLIIFGFDDGRDMLVDVTVVSPFTDGRISALAENGPGAAADLAAEAKVKKYADLDTEQYTFVAFAVETTGAIGHAAKKLCQQIHERRSRSLCSTADIRTRSAVNSLLIDLNFDLTRLNAQAILEREPVTAEKSDAHMQRARLRAEADRQAAAASFKPQPMDLDSRGTCELYPEPLPAQNDNGKNQTPPDPPPDDGHAPLKTKTTESDLTTAPLSISNSRRVALPTTQTTTASNPIPTTTTPKPDQPVSEVKEKPT